MAYQSYRLFTSAVLVAAVAAVTGCASNSNTTSANNPPPTPTAQAGGADPTKAGADGKAANAPAAAPDAPREVKSKDGKITGTILGTPKADSKFAKVEIGQSHREVIKLIGRPDGVRAFAEEVPSTPPSHKKTYRSMFELTYNNEGLLTFTDLPYSAKAQLVKIKVDENEKAPNKPKPAKSASASSSTSAAPAATPAAGAEAKPAAPAKPRASNNSNASGDPFKSLGK